MESPGDSPKENCFVAGIVKYFVAAAARSDETPPLSQLSSNNNSSSYSFPVKVVMLPASNPVSCFYHGGIIEFDLLSDLFETQICNQSDPHLDIGTSEV